MRGLRRFPPLARKPQNAKVKPNLHSCADPQGREADIFDRSIDLLVSRLRQRLRDDAREAACIKTVRNEGYVFTLPLQLLEPGS